MYTLLESGYCSFYCCWLRASLLAEGDPTQIHPNLWVPCGCEAGSSNHIEIVGQVCSAASFLDKSVLEDVDLKTMFQGYLKCYSVS